MTAAKNNRNQQCKKWEKDRRDRLKESFNVLAKLLPCYDPSGNISKIDILTKSADYILKLKTKVSDCLHPSDNCNKLESEEIEELQGRVSKLTARNEQLANLLKDANITVPTECGVQISDKTKKWSGKITPEKAEEINRSESQKENQNIVSNQKKCKPGKVKPLQLQGKKKKVKRKVKIISSAKDNIISTAEPCSTLTITNVQPIQPYYIIANNIGSTITTQATSVKNVITTPILSTTNQPNKTFTSGIILPVVQPQALINPPLFLNVASSTSSSNNAVFVVKTNKPDENIKENVGIAPTTTPNALNPVKMAKRKLALIKPKRRLGNKILAPSKFESSFILWSSLPHNQAGVKKKTRVKNVRPVKGNCKTGVKRKRKVVEDKSDVNIDQKKAKIVNNMKLDGGDDLGEAQDNVNNKKQSSDYSIDAICKENQACKDIEIVINEVVEKASVARGREAEAEREIKESHVCDNVKRKDKDKLSLEENSVLNQSQDQGQTPQQQVQQEQQKLKQMNILTQNNPQQFNPAQQQQDPTSQQQTQLLHEPDTELHLHSELSNDIFASLQVQGSQNPESTSPTAAFLNAFPLVSSFTGVKVTEVLEEETTDSPHGTPTLLQIGNLENTQKLQNAAQNNADSLTPSIINLDNFTFFNNNLYGGFDNIIGSSVTTSITNTTSITTNSIVVSNGGHAKTTSSSARSVQGQAQGPAQPQCQSINDAKIYNKKQVKASGNTNNLVNVENIPVQSHAQAQSQSQSQSQVQPLYPLCPAINYNSSNRYNEYNTFNPFELPKTTQNNTFVKGFDASGSSSYVGNSCNYGYQTGDYNYQLGKNNYYDGGANNCANFYHNSNGANNQNGASNKYASNANKKSKDNSHAHANQSGHKMVNWMAPDFAATPSNSVAKVTSYSDMGQNYLNTNNALYSGQDYGNQADAQGQPQDQTHQFPWSPTKLHQVHQGLDAHNCQLFPPSTLPTLVGDLALGYPASNQSAQPNQKTNHNKNKKQVYESGSGSILSVSQLVQHKDGERAGGARVTNRRNSGSGGNRSSGKSHGGSKVSVNKRHKEKEKGALAKNTINYSAESLIAAKQQNYPKTIPPYLPDNILPYFSHNIDENFGGNIGNIAQNQSYQNNTFGNYNNSFMPPSTTTTYLPTGNFMPEMYESPMENIFSHVNPKGNHKKSPQKVKEYTVSPAPPVPSTVANISNVPSVGNVSNVGNLGNIPPIGTLPTTKSKTKKKETFVDLSFLSMPSINSPLLPEDFHANFLPPPPNPNQLYPPCKNPISSVMGTPGVAVAPPPPPVPAITGDNSIRTKPIQHPEISPAPGSLTNFNLCTIFPEINRTNTVVPDVFRNYGNNTAQKSSNYLPNLE